MTPSTCVDAHPRLPSVDPSASPFQISKLTTDFTRWTIRSSGSVTVSRPRYLVVTTDLDRTTPAQSRTRVKTAYEMLPPSTVFADANLSTQTSEDTRNGRVGDHLDPGGTNASSGNTTSLSNIRGRRMTQQDARQFGKVIRDPVHDYIRVPNEILPVVRSIQVQRLRNISQNSRAVAVYPSMNGSRYEHALGTMHLASKAWRIAWANAWAKDDDEPDVVREAFCTEVFNFVKQYLQDNPDELDDYWREYFDPAKRDKYRYFNEHFEEMIDHTVSVVGLVHDIGHPPFSHVLEDVFEDNSIKLFTDNDFVTGYERYRKQVSGGHAQFHEYAGKEIFMKMLDDRVMFRHLPRILIKSVFNARGLLSWDSCLHQLIDGQVDVDRLDYITRDARRAGTDYDAIDSQRLLDSLELHLVASDNGDSNAWRIGLGIRGVSAIESLLLQRAQSYRWMIFHSQVLLADTALKRVFNYAVEHFYRKPISPDLDYITKWKAIQSGDLPPSYCVDDHRVTEWLRVIRREISSSNSPSNARCLALMRISDEVSPVYRAAWRSYGEYLDALGRFPGISQFGAEFQNASGTKPIDWQLKSIQEIAERAPIGESVPYLFNELLRKLDKNHPDLDVKLELLLNDRHSEIEGVDGTWVVANRAKFSALKPADSGVWEGDRERSFVDLSPIAVALAHAEQMRPLIWSFFVPFNETDTRANEKVISDAFLSGVAEFVRLNPDSEEGSE